MTVRIGHHQMQITRKNYSIHTQGSGRGRTVKMKEIQSLSIPSVALELWEKERVRVSGRGGKELWREGVWMNIYLHIYNTMKNEMKRKSHHSMTLKRKRKRKALLLIHLYIIQTFSQFSQCIHTHSSHIIPSRL